ncbi:MAG: hypothetical protein N3C12_07295 [Candidatus Binatia bacterium]|nr:hypothetical protein [Candidatus Binatia bacterium]
MLLALVARPLTGQELPPTPSPTPRPPGQTFVVSTLGDRADQVPGDGVCADASGECTLWAAITEANAWPGDDEITFAVSGTIVLREQLPAIASARTAGSLRIDGGQRVTVSGNDSVRVLVVSREAEVTLSDIRIERGRAHPGGAISNDGTLTVSNSTFSNNNNNNFPGARGGAIYNTATLTISNSTFSKNTATSEGGAINSGGSLVAKRVLLSENVANGGGGVFHRRSAG